MSLKQYIEILVKGDRNLTSNETEHAFQCILTNEADPIQVGSLLTLLRARNETSEEVAGMIRAMNSACHRVELYNDDNGSNKTRMKLLDIVGTGGDGADTINISTASTVLAAACGCIVAKGGNRSVSSACGSADVLEALGIVVDLKPEEIVLCVQQIHIAFMFGPINHPAMAYVAPIRKSLGVRTCFNIIGPLVNAASAQYSVIGVFDMYLIPIIAGAIKEVGIIEHVVIIHGVGLDEISPLGPATIYEIKNIAEFGQYPKIYQELQYEFDPLSIDIPRCQIEDLKGGNPKQNAIEFENVLNGGEYTNAKRNAIILNAGVGNYVYGLSSSIADGCALARQNLYNGNAATLLQKWKIVSNEIKNNSKQSS